MNTTAAFLLTRHWRDTPDGIEFEIWAASGDGPVRVLVTGQEAVFFVSRESPTPSGARRAALELSALGGGPVDGLYFRASRAFYAARDELTAKRVRVYESDLRSVDRFLMERFVRGGFSIEGEPVRKAGYTEFVNPALRKSDYRPALRALSVDIETSGFTGELYSIAACDREHARVFMAGDGNSGEGVEYLPDERTVLGAFFEFVNAVDPDAIIGWNVIDFDLAFLERKCRELGVPFALGRNRGNASVLPPNRPGQAGIARVPGRVVLDGIALLRTATWTFEQFSLDYVANELLGRGKLIHKPHDRLEEIRRLFREDKPALAAYNLEDCRLVLDVFDAADLISFAIERTCLSGLPMDRQGGSVATFDYRYLPLLHRHGYVAPDVGAHEEVVGSPGGYVMDSKPGLYDNVLVLDFKSLYPSIIQSFKIDPLGMAVPGENPVPGFRDAVFSRGTSILPGLIDELWQAREQAKREKNRPLSQAIKIMMNSFYGVLGTPGCRFFHPALASSITRRGHDLITRSREWIEAQGVDVLYGDTDSLFVHVGADKSEDECLALGAKLAAGLNAWWRDTLREELDLESRLEIEFETHYLRFFMPTIRGSEKGSKKRYAGLVRAASGETELQFTGLESVRTDWTPLARRFQREVFERIFRDRPYEEYVREIAADVLDGKYDGQLFYRKRIRRKLEDYTKNVPPHVQAARKLEKPGRWIEYAITLNGPEPRDALKSPLDHAHYLDRQLAPAVDSLLQLFGTSFAALTANQMEMF